ncbi:MAG TPA: colicin V production protein [Rhodopirellula sp.]|nr:MAG: colicin V production protein [Saprospirales bacterium TMED214]HBV66177.1 colicin V production protein [Rhodopirellula sp.]
METYDIIMLVVIVGATLFGAIKGFAWQLASIASIVISYVVAYKYREPISESIQAEPPWDRFLAMLILYIGTSLLIWVAFRMVRGSIDRMKLKEFDRQIGALFGLAKGALYCTLITLFAVTLSGERVREAVVQSKSGNYIANLLDRSDSVIPEELHEVVQPYLDRFNKKFDETEGESTRATEWMAKGARDLKSKFTHDAPGGSSFQAAETPSQTAFGAAPWSAQQAMQSGGNAFQR